MSSIASAFSILLCIVLGCTRVCIVVGEDLEVKVTGNVHNSESNRTSSGWGMCEERTPCVPDLMDLLRTEDIMKKVMNTQTDTLKEMKIITLGFPRPSQIVVPIYRFQQPKRISDKELPFDLLLVSNLHEPHEVVYVADMAVASDSWFPGYYWSPIVICDCGSQTYKHVGWKFTSLSPTTTGGEQVQPNVNPPYFYALIVDVNDDQYDRKNGYRVSGFHAPGWMLSNLLEQSKNVTSDI